MSIITTGQLVHWKNKDDVRPVALGDRFLFFLNGFHDWAYQSPVAAQWRHALYTSPQALMLARLALTDPDRHKIFSQYLDAESVDLVLHEIASWPIDRQYNLNIVSY